MLTKPVLYLLLSGAGLAVYVVVVLVLDLANGPIVPMHINTAVLSLLASLLLVAAMWCMVAYTRTLQDRRAESVKTYVKECLDEQVHPVAVIQLEQSAKLDELRRLIRMRPVIGANGTPIEPKAIGAGLAAAIGAKVVTPRDGDELDGYAKGYADGLSRTPIDNIRPITRS